MKEGCCGGLRNGSVLAVGDLGRRKINQRVSEPFMWWDRSGKRLSRWRELVEAEGPSKTGSAIRDSGPAGQLCW